jgi:hypothetical protein
MGEQRWACWRTALTAVAIGTVLCAACGSDGKTAADPARCDEVHEDDGSGGAGPVFYAWNAGLQPIESPIRVTIGGTVRYSFDGVERRLCIDGLIVNPASELELVTDVPGVVGGAHREHFTISGRDLNRYDSFAMATEQDVGRLEVFIDGETVASAFDPES